MLSININMLKNIMDDMRTELSREYSTLDCDEMNMVRICIMEAFDTLEEKVGVTA